MYSDWTCEMCPGYPHRNSLYEDDYAESSEEEEYSGSVREQIQPLTLPLKHGYYYFDDGDLPLSVCHFFSLELQGVIFQCVYQVEGTLYKIHWDLLQRYSSPISPMFFPPHDLPDNTPILLPVAAKDFDLFLSILYPM
jgi:hypothetical protein